MQIYPTHANRTDLLLLIGAIYYQLGNYEQCIAFNDRCILLDAQMAEAHANLANALQQLGNFDMAIIYYQVRLTCLMYLNLTLITCNMGCPIAMLVQLFESRSSVDVAGGLTGLHTLHRHDVCIMWV